MAKQLNGLKGREIAVSYRRHITRLLIIIALLIVGFLVVRSLLIPASFGEYGHYRGNNLEEQMNIPLVHQSSDFCSECHQLQLNDWMESGHRSVNCEVCHGHWEIHNGNLKTMTADKGSGACLLCHQKLTGRPSDFPQIGSLAMHLEEQEVSEEDEYDCIDCHDPHMPL